MSESKKRNERLIGGLALLFVIVFAGVLVLRYAPWGTPEQTASEATGAETDPVPVVLELDDGPVEINLRPDLAPQHVEQLTTLIEQGFYDGIVFHRVIEGFMAQTGDPTGTGTGSSELPDIPAEFTDVLFERGTVGMARSASPDSANSQFFIMFAPAPSLNGQYTVIGEVTSGMEYIDQIKKGDPAANGVVEDPDQIVSMRLAQDE